MPLTIAAEGLNSCCGCEISILNLGEVLLDLLPELHFMHSPLLMDHKYYGQRGEKEQIDIPQVKAGIISGGISNEEHLKVAREMRKKCTILIALGTCAAYGGIPALINQFSRDELFDRYYRTCETTDAADPPSEVVPQLLDRTYALDEKVNVDIYIPGCPPHPDYIAAALTALIKGERPVLPTKSVCDTCPARREKKGMVKEVRRFTENAQYEPDKPIGDMLCLLEQGFVCMGPVTRAGCAGLYGEAPSCIVARVPCRGCFGPVKQNGNQLLDMLNALASNGIDVRSVPDRSSLLRFSGAHGRLGRRKAQRPK